MKPRTGRRSQKRTVKATSEFNEAIIHPRKTVSHDGQNRLVLEDATAYFQKTHNINGSPQHQAPLSARLSTTRWTACRTGRVTECNGNLGILECVRRRSSTGVWQRAEGRGQRAEGRGQRAEGTEGTERTDQMERKLRSKHCTDMMCRWRRRGSSPHKLQPSPG